MHHLPNVCNKPGKNVDYGNESTAKCRSKEIPNTNEAILDIYDKIMQSKTGLISYILRELWLIMARKNAFFQVFIF